MKPMFKPLFFATLIFSTATANALVIEISENSDFSSAVRVDDSADTTGASNDGVVIINGGLGSWIVNVVTGLSGPAIGTPYLNKLDLNSVNVSGGQGTLYLRLTDTDFSKLEATFKVLYGGTTNGTVNFQSYLDGSNAEFGQGTLLSNTGDHGLAFSGSDMGQISQGNPYSLSIYAKISHSGAGQVTSFDYYVSVPEPGTLALLGLGLLGIAFARRRVAAAPAKS